LLASFGWGGCERVGCTVYRLARDAGHSVQLDGPDVPPIRNGIRGELGEPFERGTREDSLRRWILGARRRAREFRPDVVHAQLPWPGLFSAAAMIAGATPMLLTFQLLPHGEPWPRDYLLRVPSVPLIRSLRRIQRRRVLGAVSASDEAQLRELFPRDRLRLVRNVPPLPPLAETPRAAVCWPPAAVRLISVGRLHRQKGLDRMVAALAAPEVRTLPWHWLIVGGGDQEKPLREQIAGAGLTDRVTFAGERPAHTLIAAADLLLAPSRFEGMPLVPLEAVTSGVPVLGSRISPHVELFEPIPGALLPAEEARWPTLLAALLADPEARERVRAAQTRLRPAITRDQMWSEYEATYAELAQG
jgi:glycosyltransferase involved in cell wall biosynthesis